MKYCKYCNNKLIDFSDRYFCINHINKIVSYYFNFTGNIQAINICNQDFNLHIYPIANKTYLENKLINKEIIFNFIDNFLTPENFEQKLNTYLIFQ